VNDCDDGRIVDADEEDVIAVLPHRNSSHLSTAQRMARS
jgi:hypothetical protein